MKRLGRKTAVYTFATWALVVQVFLTGILSVNPTEAKGTVEQETEDVTSAAATYVQHQVTIVGNSELELNTPKSVYDGKAIAIEDLTVYEEASEESSTIGKLYKNGIAQIIERNGQWAYMTSGSVTGYIKCEALCFDEEAEAIATAKIIANINCDDAVMYASSDAGSEVIATLANDTKVELVNAIAGYYTVTLNDGTRGCVMKDQVLVNYNLQLAKSNEQIAAIEAQKVAAQQAAAEAARQAALAAERAKQAVTDAAKQRTYNIAVARGWDSERIRIAVEHTTAGNTYTYNAPMTVSEEEVLMLATIVGREAGNQSYEGRLAVANVVLNRVRSPRFANSVREVLVAPGQFSGTADAAGNLTAEFKALMNSSLCTNNIGVVRDA
ncbi:MAG: cell wall hydrolase, partial [Lachnospiraceae bacterium]